MRVVVFGGSGLVGSSFIENFKDIFEINAPGAEMVDILDKDLVHKAIEDFNPDSVINFAAYTQVEEAEDQLNDKEGICYKINALGAKNVAEVCKQLDKHLIHISTEYVFDGEKEFVPYNEEDSPNPKNWYGQTKYFGEKFVAESGVNAAVARISMPFSPFFSGKKDVARFFLQQLKDGNKIRTIEDQNISPTIVLDIVKGIKVLIDNKASGIYHISSKDDTTPLDFAKTIAEIFKLDYSLINSVSLEEYNKNKKGKLLKNSSLNPTKFEKEFGDDILHTIDEALLIFKEQIENLKSGLT